MSGGRVFVVAAPGEPRRLALEGTRLAGAVVAAEAGWGDPLDADADLLLIDTGGEAAVALAPRLERIAALAEAQGCPIVAVIERAHIDLAAAVLFGPHVQLLCEPGLPALVAALVFAGVRAPGGLRDPARDEAEAARLLRLSEEVARIADALARIARREDEAPEALGERPLGYRPPPAEPAPAVAPAELRAAIRARRLRDEAFGPGWFDDPAWDMLLDLYAAELERMPVSVSSLCIAAAVAPTTALRWIARMSEADLLERRPDPRDRRRVFMGLTDAARVAMERYVTAVKRAGLVIA